MARMQQVAREAVSQETDVKAKQGDRFAMTSSGDDARSMIEPRISLTTTGEPAAGSDPSPLEIIAAARQAPAEMRGAVLVACASGLLMWGAFAPLNWGPLGWVCLMPLLLLARMARPTRRLYLACYLGGLVFWVPTLQWMRLGHPTMYTAWIALSLYLAAYFPAFIALTRTAVGSWRVPLTIAAPVIWTGLELLRGHLMTGFAWYYLGHTQYRWLELIQISDLVGAYGVSFVMVLVAACATELLPTSILERCRLLPPFSPTSPSHEPAADHNSPSASLTSSGSRTAAASLTAADHAHSAGPIERGTGGRGPAAWRIITCATVLTLTLGYGYGRRNQADFQPGPRVALVQSNVPTEVKHDPRDHGSIFERNMRLTAQAVKQQPDLIIWPETMFSWPVLETPAGVTDEQLVAAHPQVPASYLDYLRKLDVKRRLTNISQMSGAAVVFGLEALDLDLDHVHSYNSALLVRPETGAGPRYDKIHRVIFGEYIPLADVIPGLHKFTPFAAGYGIQAGQRGVAFEHAGYRFAPVICFEDTVPHLVRAVLRSTQHPATHQRVDFLVNLTNDGWFHGSSELDQHLVTAAFRCVEYRTPMVRAVNTGISAFIDGDGAIRQRAFDPETRRSKQVEAVVVGHLPLDRRTSLYLATGDWFAGLCLSGCVLLVVLAPFRRRLVPTMLPVHAA